MEEHKHQERYGKWGGNPLGNKANKQRCAVEIQSHFLSYQCSRKGGYGPNGIYCKQHAKRFEVDKTEE